jgi:hypothetical protein
VSRVKDIWPTPTNLQPFLIRLQVSSSFWLTLCLAPIMGIIGWIRSYPTHMVSLRTSAVLDGPFCSLIVVAVTIVCVSFPV